MGKSSVPAVALALTALCGESAARAQEPPPPPPPPRPQEEPPPPPPKPREELRQPTRPPKAGESTAPDFLGFALGDVFEWQIVGDERVLAAVGGLSQPVLIRLPGFDLRCESVVVWGHRDRLVEAVEKKREAFAKSTPEQWLGPVIHAVYAEGRVHVKRPGQTIEADRLFLDFQKGKAYFVRSKMTAELPAADGRKVPLSVRAEVTRARTRNLYRAENARFTTCDYADPHYEFSVDWIEVDTTHADASFETSWWPTVRMDTLAGKDTPILALPKLGGTTRITAMPLQGVNIGGSSRFGTEIELTWGGDVKRADGTKWGDWRLHTDLRTARGPGLGVDVSHESAPERGRGRSDSIDFSAYWQRDDEDRDSFSDRAFHGGVDVGRNDPDRGFAHLFTRHFLEDPGITGTIGKGWRVDSELSWYSDRGYLPEYHAARSRTEKQQETYLHARNTWGNQGVSVFASYRLNDEAAALDRLPGDLFLTDYENQTQYLPSVGYHLIGKELLAREKTGLFPVDLSLDASVANVERRYDERIANRIERATGWDSEMVQRGDVEARIATPFSLGDIRVDPAFGGSLYGVSDANGFLRQDDGGDGRSSAFANLRVGTQAWKLYPTVKSSFFDLDGLRHVISLDTQYFDRFHVSDDPLTFQGNDLVDDLVDERIASLRLRNRLQTKRDGEVWDWFDYETRFLHFFEDTPEMAGAPFGLREDFPMPLQRIDFPGEDKYTAFQRDGSAFWQHRVRIAATRTLWLVGEADYDIERSFMETSMVGVRWFAADRASLYVGRRTIHGDSAIITVRGDYRLSDRWGVALEHQQETRRERGLRTTLSLFRRAHDYTIAIEFQNDLQGNNRGVALAIYPNDWLGGRQDPFKVRRPLDYAAQRWYR